MWKRFFGYPLIKCKGCSGILPLFCFMHLSHKCVMGVWCDLSLLCKLLHSQMPGDSDLTPDSAPGVFCFSLGNVQYINSAGCITWFLPLPTEYSEYEATETAHSACKYCPLMCSHEMHLCQTLL